jgi:chromosome segregation protein
MKVTRLHLHGFKSFVDATDVPVQPGLTGVVGPNGCGKSNLVEALRFVMGESSYKAMRGGGMEDVIFSGSGGRPARNMAEVTLMAERDEGRGAGPEVVEITRRIERDSGSTYRINGREVRARDVQLVFADAATGAHSTALVRQGRVAELIAAKPVQRRGILEDAAGISGLHARRNEAEQKLKGAEQNLERLDDVMNEINGRLEGLRKQARQAVRYRKISSEIQKSEAVLYVIHWRTAEARLAEAIAELKAAKEAFAAAAAMQQEATEQEKAAADLLPELRRRAGEAASRLERLKLAAKEIDREEAERKGRREELIARRADAAADLSRETEIGSEAATAAERLDDEEAKLRAGNEAAADRIAATRAGAEEAAAAVTAREAEFSAAAGALAAAAAERGARERAMREAQAKLRRLEDERNAVHRQRDKIVADHGGDAAVKDAAAALAEVEALFAEKEQEAQAAHATFAAARDTERRARGPMEAAERSYGALQAEARALAQSLDLDRTTRFAPLLDSLEVTPGYERALAAALGDDLDASLDSEAPAFWGDSQPGSADFPLPSGVAPLAEFVRGPQNLARRLRQIGVVSADQAETLQAELAAGQRLVTRDGGLWRWDGFRATPGSAASGARRLEQRNRVAEVVHELKAAKRSLETALDLFGTATQVRAEAEFLDTDARRALQEARQALDARREAMVEAERHQSRIAERLSAFAGALARIEADTDTSRAELRAAGDALDGLPDTAALEEARNKVQAALAKERGHAAEARLGAERSAHEETVRMRRITEIASERERWAGRVKRAEERMTALRERLQAIDTEIAASPDDPSIFERRRLALSGDTEAAEQLAAETSRGLSMAESGYRSAQERVRSLLESLSDARETRARDEERVIAAEARKAELSGQIAEHFDCQYEALLEIAGLAADAQLPDAGAAEARLHRLRSERERLGSVNLRAEEEATELETRLGEMRTEHEDLEEAIKRLRQGIQNLNREGRERLLKAFEAVNAHFASLFQKLFQGGTAELTLIGSDDPLEAGLEIVARPPGKRPQTMTLLSGGEQALTAMALIFAVFLTNPSPICVLDEVDAPLDDANVERFCNLLEEMRERTETRFVVVTHNPITMARMDRLFGVTMAERGVSQIVSVDLAAAERFREAS